MGRKWIEVLAVIGRTCGHGDGQSNRSMEGYYIMRKVKGKVVAVL
jgi:hypothetical protein